jgi:Beta-propeller repeat
VNPTQASFGGSTDAFVSVLNPGSNTLTFSTYLGGSGDEDQLSGGIAVDPSKKIYVTGDTDSGNGTTTAFPTVNPFDGSWTSGGPCTNSSNLAVPCPDGFITAYTAP